MISPLSFLVDIHALTGTGELTSGMIRVDFIPEEACSSRRSSQLIVSFSASAS